MICTPVRAAFLATLMSSTGFLAAASVKSSEYYSDSSCEGTPETLIMSEDTSCLEEACSSTTVGTDTYYMTVTCDVSDYDAQAAEVFAGTEYMVLEYYAESGCDTMYAIEVHDISISCSVAPNLGSYWFSGTIVQSTTAVMLWYAIDSCDNGSPTGSLESDDFTSGTCVEDLYKMYYYSSSGSYDAMPSSEATSNSSSGITSSSEAMPSSSPGVSADSSGVGSDEGDVASDSGSSSGVSVGVIAGIVVSAIVIIVLLLLCFWCRRRRGSKPDDGGSTLDEPANAPKSLPPYSEVRSPAPMHASAGTTLETGSRRSRGSPDSQRLTDMQNDGVIATARLPREKVVATHLLSRGGFGEVYSGIYNGQSVAIKMLLPETRKSIKHVNGFLAEVKLMASLDHPRIVQFIGVAWDSLADICIVLEYMEGGDLRALLNKYHDQGHPEGFDRRKVSIAMHVAHALTYLHSLQPPVLHRDLKSKNILLSSTLDAKLTDFGISRERVNETMTANVGTSLWMAPEVMLGERYDDKADMFSFGVVLSELDVHVLPYSHAKENSASGLKVPEAAILQMVALGKLRVKFSSGALASVVELGEACVALDPTERPTAAEALYKLHTVLTQEL